MLFQSSGPSAAESAKPSLKKTKQKKTKNKQTGKADTKIEEPGAHTQGQPCGFSCSGLEDHPHATGLQGEGLLVAPLGGGRELYTD